MACTTDICGEFSDPSENEKGQCTPRRLKSSCDVPLLYTNVDQTVELPCPEGTVGETISVTVSAGTINNPFSVAAANAAALAQAEAEAAVLRAASPCLYENTEQSCEDVCPEGTEGETISVTIPAGSFSSAVSQEAADAAALAEACAEVADLRAASPCVEPEEPELPEPGSLWGWGLNSQHYLGTGDDTARSMPSLIDEDDPDVHWSVLSTGRFFGGGIKSDGTLWMWGQNQNGNMGNGQISVFPSVAYDHYKAIQVGSSTEWRSLSVSTFTCLALKADGTLWAWGYTGDGALGFATSPANILEPTQVGTDDDWVKISAGRQHSLALKADGSLWGSGSAANNQLGPNGSGTELDFGCQVPGTWSDMSAGNDGSYGVQTDGTLWVIGVLGTPLTQIETDSDWESVKGPGLLTNIAARKQDGTIWTMGGNNLGQCGLGHTTPVAVMTQVGVDTWTDYSVSLLSHVLAVKSDGTLWGWGGDGNSQLGQASPTTSRSSPIQIGPDEFWVICSAGYGFSHATRSVLTEPPPPTGISGVALGGNVTITGGYHIHTFGGLEAFTSGDNFQVVDGAGVSFDILVVGGGGGGGGRGGGGGGAFAKLTGQSLSDGDYPVTIGQRGLAGGGTESPGINGGPSSFNGTTCAGGGGGGAGPTDDSANVGKDGASGGGGGSNNSGGAGGPSGGAASAGNIGGDGVHGPSSSGGGGGGTGGAGTNGSFGDGGDGGDGTSDSITGTATVYCIGAGGAGGTSNGNGGNGIGFGVFRGANADTIQGEFGKTPGSGGGAGFIGGQGAAGVVIIRYLSPP